MDTRVYIYYCFLVTCFIISLFYHKYDARLKLVTVLLALSVLTELIVVMFKVFDINKSNHFVLYHIFTPVEYALIAGYYHANASGRVVKKVMMISIYLFVSASALISLSTLPILKYPSLNNKINYLLIICMSTIILLDMKPQANERILSKPLFWIAIGFMIYCTGVFFFNSLYSYLSQHNPQLAKTKFNLLNSIFNNILYTLISLGFVCSRKMQKSYRQSLLDRS